MKNKISVLPIVWSTLLMGGAYASDAPDLDFIADEEIIEIYDETMQDAAATRARIEEVLKPAQESVAAAEPERMLNITTGIMLPRELFDMWKKMLVQKKFVNCPFDTAAECDIWRTKPTIRENMLSPEPKLVNYKLTDINTTLNVTGKLDINSPVAAPLLERYKMLMRAANACCTDGMVYTLRRAGASEGLIYKFMVDDANFYGIGERCLMMTDADLDAEFPDEPSTVATVSDVRNRCLCQSRQKFYDMLAPFMTVWRANPQFAETPFSWTYTDGLNRPVTVSINYDVQNVLDQLAQCP